VGTLAGMWCLAAFVPWVEAASAPGTHLGWLLPEMSTVVGVVVTLVLELGVLVGIVFLWCLAVLNAGAVRGGETARLPRDVPCALL